MLYWNIRFYQLPQIESTWRIVKIVALQQISWSTLFDAWKWWPRSSAVLQTRPSKVFHVCRTESAAGNLPSNHTAERPTTYYSQKCQLKQRHMLSAFKSPVHGSHRVYSSVTPVCLDSSLHSWWEHDLFTSSPCSHHLKAVSLWEPGLASVNTLPAAILSAVLLVLHLNYHHHFLTWIVLTEQTDGRQASKGCLENKIIKVYFFAVYSYYWSFPVTVLRSSRGKGTL